MSRLGDYLTEMNKVNETEMTLAFILIDLADIGKRQKRFTASQEDQLLAIEQAARELRNKL